MSKSALYEEKRRPRIASPFGYSFLLFREVLNEKVQFVNFVPAGL